MPPMTLEVQHVRESSDIKRSVCERIYYKTTRTKYTIRRHPRYSLYFFLETEVSQALLK